MNLKKRWLFIILFGLVVLFGLWENASETGPRISSHFPSWLMVQYGEIPLWAYIIGAAIIIFALSKTSFGWVLTTFKTGGFWMQLLTSFLVLATFFYLLSKMYPDAPLFQPGEGYGHIFMYFVLVGLMALVAANLKGKAWFVNIVLVVLMFAMIGHRTADLLDPSGKLSARIASILSFGGGKGSQVASPITPECDGKLTVYTYGPGKIYNMNEHTCQVRAYVMEGCVKWYDAGRLYIGGTCKGGSLPFGIKYMEPESNAVVRLNHCVNNTQGNLVDSCT